MTKAPGSDKMIEKDPGGFDMKRTKAIITIVLIMAGTLIFQGFINPPGGVKA